MFIASVSKRDFVSLVAYLKEFDLLERVTHVQYNRGNFFPILDKEGLMVANLIHTIAEITEYQREYMKDLMDRMETNAISDEDREIFRIAEKLLDQKILIGDVP